MKGFHGGPGTTTCRWIPDGLNKPWTWASNSFEFIWHCISFVFTAVSYASAPFDFASSK